MTRTRLLLAVAAVLAVVGTACAGEATTEDAASGDAPAAGACLAGAEDCQDTGGDMGAPPPDGGELPANPDEPVTNPADGGDGDTPNATQVEPTDGLEDIRAIGWDRVDVNPDDQTEVTVYWTSGVAPCNALAEVQVEYAEDAVTLTVLEGTVPSDEPQACIEIAQMKRTTVTLDEELGPRSILDGAE